MTPTGVTSRRRLAAALSVLLVGAPVARSSEADDDARRHYDLGQRHFNVGEFDHAIEEFKRAYEISPAPGLLFNIAQAYRAKKDNEKALFFYTSYLREDPAGSERPYVEQRIEELRAADEGRRALLGSPTGRTVDASHGRGLRVAGVVVGGTGLALATASVVFGLKAAHATSAASDSAAMRGRWGPAEADLWADGQSYQTAAWVLGAVGVGAIATGGVLYFLGTRDPPVTVGASPARGGAGVTVQGRF